MTTPTRSSPDRFAARWLRIPLSTRQKTVGVGILGALVALSPLVVTSADARIRGAEGLCLVAAAMGLALAVGLAGLPSLGQGAFVGLGAYTTAILRHHRAGPIAATAAGVAVAALAGAALALGITRFRPALIALTTWLAAWIFAIAVGAFPGLTGGAHGIVLGRVRQHSQSLGITVTAGPVALFEFALAAALVTAAVFVAIRHRYGAVFAAIRHDPPAAASAGVPVNALRQGALVASAFFGGLAGAVYVQAVGVADPTAYGPLLSVKLLIAVLVGGGEAVAGPVVGLVALVAVSRLAAAIGELTGSSRLRLEPVAAAILLIPVLLLGGNGLVRRRRRNVQRHDGWDDEAAPTKWSGAAIEARDVTVAFGGVLALDRLSFAAPAGTCRALVGHNGSGKSTFLKVLAGALRPTAGVVECDGRIGRTLQRLAVAPELTALEHVVSGAEPARSTGPLRAALATPSSRAESRAIQHRASELLAMVGLGDRAGARAAELDGAEQRLVQVARALAGEPSVLLLDEPAAGLGLSEQRRLIDVLQSLKDAGLTLVLVEHRQAVVDALADDVTVVEAGRVVDGPPQRDRVDAAAP